MRALTSFFLTLFSSGLPVSGGGNFDQILELLNSRFLGNPVSAASLIGKLEMPRAGLEYLWTGY